MTHIQNQNTFVVILQKHNKICFSDLSDEGKATVDLQQKEHLLLI